jgi:hypothetical protein
VKRGRGDKNGAGGELGAESERDVCEILDTHTDN